MRVVLYFLICKQVVHLLRHAAAEALSQRRHVSPDLNKFMGRWVSSVWEGSYAVNFKPPAGLVALAGFDARFPEQYNVPRSTLKPPDDVLSEVSILHICFATYQKIIQVFPWADQALDEVMERNRSARSEDDQDWGAVAFLRAVRALKVVRLADDERND